MKNTKVLYVLVVLALFVGFIGVFTPTTTTIIEKVKEISNYGAQSGQDQSARQFLRGGVSVGGDLSTTTTASTYTTVAKDFRGEPTVWKVLPNIDTTFTINATSTHGYVPQVGDVATIYIQNASTTAAASITFAEGEGVDLQDNEDSADLALVGLDWMKVTFIRTTKYAVAVILDEFTEAD